VALGIAGVFFICTALSYAEGTAMLPEAGGSASFARHGFNDLTGSIAGWALAFSYIVTITISTYTATAYLGYFWGALSGPVGGTIAAIGIVFFLMCLNILGVKESSIFNGSFAVLDVLTQVLIVFLAIWFIFAPHPGIFFHNVFDNWPSTEGLLLGTAMAAVAYTGVETISQLSEEARRPRISAPRAYIVMGAVVMVLFIGISISAFSTMTPTEMALEWARDPIAGIAAGLSGTVVPAEVATSGVAIAILSGILKLLPMLVAVLGATILIIACNAGLIGISRLTFSLGRFQFIPLTLSKVHPKFKTPYRAIFLFSSVSILLLVPGFFPQAFPNFFIILGSLYVFGSLLAFSLTHASIIRLRIKEPELFRPFKPRGNITVRGYELPLYALIGVVATSAMWLTMVIINHYALGIGLGWMASGLIFYLVFRRRKKLPLVKTAPEINVPLS